MPVFVWEGTTTSGEAKSGEMNATNTDEVTQRLKSLNISPSKIKKKGDSAGLKIKIPGIGGVPSKNLVIFTRQFATMIDAGLPLVQCLELLGNAEPHKTFKAIIF
ncbi:MAG: type II secretion system F family protein, partial [Myxococcota bacterium]|nr:type II secretion system F family protein [Myxococcota bacterium]